MTTKSPDPNEAGRNWESPEVAEHWRRNQARRAEHIGPATEMMLDLAALQIGHRVLDVAAGTGGQTLLAARRVGPTGSVLATDLSAAMLNVAAEAARKAGLTNIETQVVDAHNLDGEAESFDRVICRSGLMLFSDPPRVLRQIHRVLKRGGKFAALVFRRGKEPLSGDPFFYRAPSRRENSTAFLARRPAAASGRLPRWWLRRYHRPSGEPPTTFLICCRGDSRPQRDDFYSGGNG
jgi:SAM-dependent methyltransferase